MRLRSTTSQPQYSNGDRHAKVARYSPHGGATRARPRDPRETPSGGRGTSICATRDKGTVRRSRACRLARQATAAPLHSRWSRIGAPPACRSSVQTPKRRRHALNDVACSSNWPNADERVCRPRCTDVAVRGPASATQDRHLALAMAVRPRSIGARITPTLWRHFQQSSPAPDSTASADPVAAHCFDNRSLDTVLRAARRRRAAIQRDEAIAPS